MIMRSHRVLGQVQRAAWGRIRRRVCAPAEQAGRLGAASGDGAGRPAAAQRQRRQGAAATGGAHQAVRRADDARRRAAGQGAQLGGERVALQLTSVRQQSLLLVHGWDHRHTACSMYWRRHRFYVPLYTRLVPANRTGNGWAHLHLVEVPAEGAG